MPYVAIACPPCVSGPLAPQDDPSWLIVYRLLPLDSTRILLLWWAPGRGLHLGRRRQQWLWHNVSITGRWLSVGYSCGPSCGRHRAEPQSFVLPSASILIRWIQYSRPL